MTSAGSKPHIVDQPSLMHHVFLMWRGFHILNKPPSPRITFRPLPSPPRLPSSSLSFPLTHFPFPTRPQTFSLATFFSALSLPPPRTVPLEATYGTSQAAPDALPKLPAVAPRFAHLTPDTKVWCLTLYRPHSCILPCPEDSFGVDAASNADTCSTSIPSSAGAMNARARSKKIAAFSAPQLASMLHARQTPSPLPPFLP